MATLKDVLCDLYEGSVFLYFYKIIVITNSTFILNEEGKIEFIHAPLHFKD